VADRRIYPWGPKQVLAGVGGFVAIFLIVNVLIVIVAINQGDDFATDDIGDVFEKAAEVAAYGEARLSAAARETELPEPPRILANQVSLQAAMLVTILSQVLLFFVVRYASRQTVRELITAMGLNRFSFGRFWLAGGMVVVAYIGIFIYAVAAQATGISWLEPNSTVPSAITRDDLTLTLAAIATLIGAPLGEEVFFRGFMFSGLVRWGFWPAALLSGGLFSLVHFDPGSLVPFLIIATVLAWLYWRRGSLWDAIVFHVLFNGLSFSILVATT